MRESLQSSPFGSVWCYWMGVMSESRKMRFCKWLSQTEMGTWEKMNGGENDYVGSSLSFWSGSIWEDRNVGIPIMLILSSLATPLVQWTIEWLTEWLNRKEIFPLAQCLPFCHIGGHCEVRIFFPTRPILYPQMSSIHSSLAFSMGKSHSLKHQNVSFVAVTPFLKGLSHHQGSSSSSLLLVKRCETWCNKSHQLSFLPNSLHAVRCWGDGAGMWNMENVPVTLVLICISHSNDSQFRKSLLFCIFQEGYFTLSTTQGRSEHTHKIYNISHFSIYVVWENRKKICLYTLISLHIQSSPLVTLH